MRKDEAETFALQALAWISTQPDLLRIFFDASGLDPGAVGRMVPDPAFLGGVLDFLLGADQHVIGFCDAHGLPYDLPARARAALPGGDLPNWT